MNVVKPNIILFLTDHFRHDALGNNTENLIQLANSGINYVNSYCASPLCQPSRNSIITGLLPHQNSIRRLLIHVFPFSSQLKCIEHYS